MHDHPWIDSTRREKRNAESGLTGGPHNLHGLGAVSQQRLLASATRDVPHLLVKSFLFSPPLVRYIPLRLNDRFCRFLFVHMPHFIMAHYSFHPLLYA